jgi:hypothetical protein
MVAIGCSCSPVRVVLRLEALELLEGAIDALLFEVRQMSDAG